MSNAIEFHNVSKRFNLSQSRAQTVQESLIHFLRGQWRREPAEEFWALRDVSFEVPREQSVGLIGSNGSGKSTALKLLTGILMPTEGEIVVRGRVLALLELGTGMHPDLTGRENIFLNGSLLGVSADEVRRRYDEIAAFSEIGHEFLDMPVKHYSSGMYVRLAFAVAVHFDPEILVVDEVLAVGDAGFQQKCLARISEMRREGVTILMVSHDLGTMQSFCDRLIWFDNGEIRAAGDPNDVAMEYMHATADGHVGRSRPAAQAAATAAALGEAPAARDEGAAKRSRGRRWGTGRVRITGVTICDETGRERSAFTSGSPLELQIRYRADSRVEDPVFGVGLFHSSGTHLSGPNSAIADLEIPFVEGEGVVRYRIDALPLLQGSYLLSLSCHARDDSEMYDYHDRLYNFTVFQGHNKERLGLMTLGGHWYVDEAEPEAPLLVGVE